jgi:hypothetical protein
MIPSATGEEYSEKSGERVGTEDAEIGWGKEKKNGVRRSVIVECLRENNRKNQAG